MKIQSLFACMLLSICSLQAQIRLEGYNQEMINPALMEGRWKARWISTPDESAGAFGIYHFRKSFDLDVVPQRFVVHVSADNRYKLYINGRFVSLGPARGDLYNWNFETVDLAPFLRRGKNTLSAVVWNYADRKPTAQVTAGQTGFIVQGNGEAESVVDTDGTWLTIRNEGYDAWNGGRVMGYFVAGPGEELTAAAYPWGWQQPDYDDGHWKEARTADNGAVKGARDYSGRLLVPAPIPPMEMTIERFAAVRVTEGITAPEAFPARDGRITIPARSKVRLLLDNARLTTGYLSILFSGGKDAEIVAGYAEALYGPGQTGPRLVKGHRDEVEGKTFFGYQDRIVADGGDKREFTSLWWRTWRYVDLAITTGVEPLTIDDVYGTFSAYPFERVNTFSAPGHDDLGRMLDIGWRTARLCANETYMDCPYYEQLQYFGDTRIQAMVTMFNTRDPYMVRNAIEQGRQSIVADGLTMSRYPSQPHQFIPSFSIWWLCMAHDYWMYRGDEEYMKSLLPAFRGVLAWFEQWLKPDFSLDRVPHWFFADWSPGFPTGEPFREERGNSAIQDLMYVMALEAVGAMERGMGMEAMADHYFGLAARIRETIRPKYWDADRGLFADTHDHRNYSQHTNALAILTDLVEGEEAAAVMTRTLADMSLNQASIYFRYYINQALGKAGLGDRLLDNLQVWRDQMALGLTTWAETTGSARSDCHAWGASPNIEFYRILLGIESTSPGFRTVRIAPSLGELKEVSGTMPHPGGDIGVSYKVSANGRLEAKITLPPGTSGVFEWKGRSHALVPGEQTISER